MSQFCSFTFRQSLPFFVVFSLWLSGCASHDKIEYSDLEGKVPPRFFNALTHYDVSETWLISQLGPANLVQKGHRGQTILTYFFMRHDYHVRRFFPFFTKGRASHDQVYMHFVVVDGLVRSHWSDKDATVNVTSLPANTRLIRDEITPK